MRHMCLSVIAIVAIGLALVLTESLHRIHGLYPVQYPGWMMSEYLDRLDSINPTTDIIFVGDSRVGWGVADRAISREMKQSARQGKAVNLGLPGTSVTLALGDLLNYFPRASGGRIVINFSVGAFYAFGKGSWLRYPETLQQRVDQHVVDWFTRNFSLAHSSPIDLFRIKPPSEEWSERIVFAEGFVNAKILSADRKPVDAAEFQLSYYQTKIAMLSRSQDEARGRLDHIKDLIELLRRRGWALSLIRLPTGERMRSIENTIPASLAPETVARVLGLTLIDMSEDKRFPTQDESHLTPAAAVSLAPLLAQIGLNELSLCGHQPR